MKFLLLLSILVMVPFAGSAQVFLCANTGGNGYYVSMQTEPDTSSLDKELGVVWNREQVELLASTPDHYLIRNIRDQIGYVSKSSVGGKITAPKVYKSNKEAAVLKKPVNGYSAFYTKVDKPNYTIMKQGECRSASSRAACPY